MRENRGGAKELGSTSDQNFPDPWEGVRAGRKGDRKSFSLQCGSKRVLARTVGTQANVKG